MTSFTNQRIGINALKNKINVLPELPEKSGIQVKYTNHFLRATAIVRTFNGEKVIVETRAKTNSPNVRILIRFEICS